MRLLYLADPLCSWCYGFGPELDAVVDAHPGTEIELVMGGLRAFNREPASAAFRDMIRGHWQQVAQASGLPFNESLLSRDGWIYDTEPACRAVVTARLVGAPQALALFKAIQAAFYRDGSDVTQAGVLADVAAECGHERALFLVAMESEAMREATKKDFERTQSLGVNGFPTLALADEGQLYLVTSGLITRDLLEARLAEIEHKKKGVGAN